MPTKRGQGTSTAPPAGGAGVRDPLADLAVQILALRDVLQRPDIKAAMQGRPMQEFEYGIAAFRQRFPATWADALQSSDKEPQS